MLKSCFAISVLLSWLFISCGGGQSQEGTGDVRKFIGYKVVIPKGLKNYVYGMDQSAIVLDTTALKILTYFDAEGCTPCKLKTLFQWSGYMNDGATVDSSLQFLYILNTSNTTEKEVNLILDGCRFGSPVFYDPDGDFERLNPGLPENPLFHTFLLDRQNRVVLVGSPIGNPRMWELYKETIAKLIASGGELPDPE